ncbi:hypothetical protein HK100_004750 [Physocladia obscura]|uniref:Uncharacterized protein n=1 Tax=Physocladia obscura TaxID=109957 RepID=A0AAD5TCB1_9FUNG|nr:hypothetical protein HK100_004750 [Physocladia obscura]
MTSGSVEFDEELDYSEFRLFVLAAIEMQSRIDAEIEPLTSRIMNFVRSKLEKWNIPFLSKPETMDINQSMAELALAKEQKTSLLPGSLIRNPSRKKQSASEPILSGKVVDISEDLWAEEDDEKDLFSRNH